MTRAQPVASVSPRPFHRCAELNIIIHEQLHLHGLHALTRIHLYCFSDDFLKGISSPSKKGGWDGLTRSLEPLEYNSSHSSSVLRRPTPTPSRVKSVRVPVRYEYVFIHHSHSDGWKRSDDPVHIAFSDECINTCVLACWVLVHAGSGSDVIIRKRSKFQPTLSFEGVFSYGHFGQCSGVLKSRLIVDTLYRYAICFDIENVKKTLRRFFLVFPSIPTKSRNGAHRLPLSHARQQVQQVLRCKMVSGASCVPHVHGALARGSPSRAPAAFHRARFRCPGKTRTSRGRKHRGGESGPTNGV